MNGINMNTTKIMPMKGLLKGLRYISQIFDDEKGEQMQIGLPTDVKHVAHIGMDGSSANAPIWMNEYNPNSETTPVSPKGESKQKSSINPLCEETVTQNITVSEKLSIGQLDSPSKHSSRKTKHKRSHSSSSSTGSADRDSFNLSKPRQNKHSGEIGSLRSEHSRRHKHSSEIGCSTSEEAKGLQNQNTGLDSLLENPPKILKSRRKKSRGSSGSGSLRSSRSKGSDPFLENSPYSGLGPSPGFENNEVRSNTV